jgi:hypothetical protein
MPVKTGIQIAIDKPKVCHSRDGGNLLLAATSHNFPTTFPTNSMVGANPVACIETKELQNTTG